MGAGALNEARISTAIGDGVVLGRRIEVHARAVSTNDLAGAQGAGGEPEGLVVVAESQSAGRGRRGSRWISRPGRDLLFSILLRPPGEPDSWPWLVHGASVGVARVVEAISGLPIGIKWPNDVYLPGNRKVCGILMETVVGAGPGGRGYAVLGIGLNVNSGGFPDEIGDRAVSLGEACGGGLIDREKVLVDLLQELDAIYRGGAEARAATLREAERRSVLQGRKIAVGDGGGRGERIEGRFAGFGAGGSLRLEVEGGAERIFHGAEHVELIQ